MGVVANVLGPYLTSPDARHRPREDRGCLQLDRPRCHEASLLPRTDPGAVFYQGSVSASAAMDVMISWS